MKNPVITISRQYGSGGRLIRAKLSERLNIPLYDKRLFYEAAQRSNILEGFFEQAEERNQPFCGHAFDTALSGNYLAFQDWVFLSLARTMQELAEKGPCIIMGRGGNQILKDRKDVLNVYLYASMEQRIRRVVQETGMKPEEAERKIGMEDKNRALYLKHYTDQMFGDACNYHLCLDSGSLGIENTVEIICGAYQKGE